MASKSSRAGRRRPVVSAKPGPRVMPLVTNRLAMSAPGGDASSLVSEKPSRMESFMRSVGSVQAPSEPRSKPPSRAYKIGLWLVMLMPVYAIIIYIVGFFILLPAAVQNVGVSKSLPANVKSVAGQIAVPDHNGVFLQTSLDPHQQVAELQQFNDSGLQPPRDQQIVLAPTGLQYILVQDAQVSQPSDYKVYLIGKNGETLIPTQGVRVPAPKIAEMAISMPKGQTWAPGSYMLDYLIAGMAPEDAYCFFTISPNGK